MSPLLRYSLLALSGIHAAALCVRADVALPPIFTDHMVLQREQPVRVWGTADPGEAVTVSFAGQNRSAQADTDGRWAVALDPLAASFKPRTLTVEGTNRLVFEDVLVGEVWLGSGQSNMEKPLGKKRGQRPTDNHLTEIAAARFPHIRLYQVPHHGKVKQAEHEMQWLPCSPEFIEASGFSALAYFFGRELHHNLDVPVGLIHSSFGGTMIEAWIPRASIDSDPRMRHILEETYFAWVKGVQATELYESMITPVAPYTLRGFLWYQGEANAMNGEGTSYTDKMRALVEGWRTVWDAPEAPFLYVQLAPFNYSAWDSFPAWLTPEGLPLFWEAQTAALAIPHTGMVVTTDLAGDTRDIHPTNKRDIGIRLAHLALTETYDFEDRHARSPRFDGMEVGEDGSLRIRFRDVGDGLRRSDGNPLSHFQVADKSRVFHPAEARILADDTVVLFSASVSAPVAARFAWHETATPNLENSAGLPAIPFRTDDWPVDNVRPTPEAARN